jgi:hypothetical protein
MDSKLILEAARGTLDGTLSFPEVVGQLLAAGVEYYHVDYVGLRKRFYSAEGEMMATSINYEGLPPVAPEFDAAALRANILDSQLVQSDSNESLRRCAKAVTKAGQIYDTIPLPLDGKSNREHLEPLREGMQLFARLAEINPPTD